MFGLAPKAPVEPEAAAWIERSMQALLSVFGHEFVQSVPVVLPTEAFFPDDWDGGEASSERFLHQVCSHMGVDPQRLRLAFLVEDGDKVKDSMPYWEGQSQGAAGLYINSEAQGKIVIAVKVSERRDLTALIGVMAHELAHVVLMADGRLPPDTEHMEPMTDLYTVFCGMGLFTANSAAKFTQFDNGRKAGWSFQRQGYLSEPSFGYALAVFTEMRSEHKPAWAKYLNTNVGAYFRQSCKAIAHARAKNAPYYARRSM